MKTKYHSGIQKTVAGFKMLKEKCKTSSYSNSSFLILGFCLLLLDIFRCWKNFLNFCVASLQFCFIKVSNSDQSHVMDTPDVLSCLDVFQIISICTFNGSEKL